MGWPLTPNHTTQEKERERERGEVKQKEEGILFIPGWEMDLNSWLLPVCVCVNSVAWLPQFKQMKRAPIETSAKPRVAFLSHLSPSPLIQVTASSTTTIIHDHCITSHSWATIVYYHLQGTSYWLLTVVITIIALYNLYLAYAVS